MPVTKKNAPKAPKALKAPADLRKVLLGKLEKAGGAGASESTLLGKSGTRELSDTLNSLLQEGMAVKMGLGTATRWFSAESKPCPVSEAVEQECASRVQTLWKETDILKAIPKYYSQSEAATALKELCASARVMKLKDGKATKYVYGQGTAPPSNNHGGYFLSEAARLIYALVVLDGESQQKELSLTPTHYRDAKLAKSWRDSIARQVHPDVCHHAKAHEAVDQLSRIYHRMTGL